MKRIAVDMDEVIADALSEHLNRYNAQFGAAITKDDMVACHLRDVIPMEHRRAADQIVHTEDFFSNLQVMPGAQEVLYKLSSKHEVFITTAAMEVPNSFNAKYRWLREHLPFISPMNYVFCGEKHIIAADYLIDDNVRHFQRFTGEGILFDAPHNRNVTGYRRVKNWHEVEQLLMPAGSPAPTAGNVRTTSAY
jgi:5'(3')-deoxyribonucleotidase